MKRLISARIRLGLAALAAISLFMLAAQPSQADLIFSAENSFVEPGTSTGNALDVTLTNTGATAVDIAGFAFQVTASSSSISFTQVTSATAAPYIFANNSFWGPDITIYGDPVVPGATISAGDNVLVPDSFMSLASGDTVGLGHVLFDVTSPLPGDTTISVVFTGGIDIANNLSDASGAPIQVSDLISGSITTPAPSTFVVSIGILFLAGLRGAGQWRRKAAA
jgi:hypothetical protein